MKKANALYRRLSAFLMAAILLVSLLPVGAMAEETETDCTTPEACADGHIEGCPEYVAPHVPCEKDAECTYSNGHEGNCSTFVPCGEEGCEYAQGHEGNHSNFVKCTLKDACTLADGHADVCNAPAEEDEGENEDEAGEDETVITCNKGADCTASTHEADCAKALADAAAAAEAAQAAAVQAELNAKLEAMKPYLTMTSMTQSQFDAYRAELSAATQYAQDNGITGDKLTDEQQTLFSQLGSLQVTVVADPSVGTAYITNNNGVVTVWGEALNSDPVNELYIDLLSGDTKIASVKLNDVGGIYAAETSSLTWHIMVLGDEYDNYWTTTWVEGYPNASTKPSKVVMYIDGEKVSESAIVESNPDNLVLVSWAQLFAAEYNGKIYGSIKAALTAAGTAPGAVITVLSDITTQPETDITVGADQDVVIDLNGKEVKGNFKVNGKATIKNGKITHSSASSAVESFSTANMTLADLIVTSNAYHAVRVRGGNVVVNSGTYVSNGTGTMHALRATDDAIVTINNGTFTGPGLPSSDGTAVSFQGKTLTIEDGVFSGGEYYAVIAAGGTTIVNGGTFYEGVDDTSTRQCIINSGGGDIVINNGRFIGKALGISGIYRCISGGVFDVDPAINVVAGKASKLGSDGTYTIVDAVASIGDQGYVTAADALTAAKHGNTVKMLADSTEDAINVEPKGHSTSFTLDLNGHKLNSNITYTNGLRDNGSGYVGSTMIITDSSEAKSGTIGALTMVNGSVELQCNVSAIAVSGVDAQLNLNGNGLTPTVTIASDTTELHLTTNGTGNSVTLQTNATKDGYTPGWKKESVAIDGNSATEDGVYSIKWIPAEYTITYQETKGAVNSNPATYTIESETITLADLSVDGYTFDGWTYDGETTPAKDVTIPKGSTGNKEFTANWTANQYTITYELNGGTHGENYPTTHTYGTATTLVAPTKTGHTFAGLYTTANFSGNAVTVLAADGYTDNITLYAKWTVNKYTLTFNTDGGTPIDPITEDYGVELEIPGTTKTGHSVEKWVNEKGEETDLPAKMPAANMTLKAVWKANKYNIVYNANGGTGADVTSELTYGVGYKLAGKPDSFTAPDGKPHFICWKDKDGKAYYAGDTVLNLATGAEDDKTVTLYAEWGANPPTEFSVTKNSFPYNGQEQGIAYTVKPENAKVTIAYTMADATTRADTRVAPVNAGTYDVTVTVEADGYTATTHTTTMTITKAPLEVSYVSETIYAGYAPKWTMMMKGFVNGETPDALEKAGAFARPELPASKPSTLGSHTITPYGGWARNYELKYVSGTLTIKEKEVYVYSETKLLQTGEAAWLIPVLAICGVSVMAAGAWITLKKKNYGR